MKREALSKQKQKINHFKIPEIFRDLFSMICG